MSTFRAPSTPEAEAPERHRRAWRHGLTRTATSTGACCATTSSARRQDARAARLHRQRALLRPGHRGGGRLPRRPRRPEEARDARDRRRPRPATARTRCACCARCGCAAKLGLPLDPQDARADPRAAPLMEHVPPARLFDEMLKLLLSGHASACLRQLRDVGLHHGLLPLLDVILEQPLGERFVTPRARADRRARARRQAGVARVPVRRAAVARGARRVEAREGARRARHPGARGRDGRGARHAVRQARHPAPPDRRRCARSGRCSRASTSARATAPYRAARAAALPHGYDFLALRAASGEVPTRARAMVARVPERRRRRARASCCCPTGDGRAQAPPAAPPAGRARRGRRRQRPRPEPVTRPVAAQVSFARAFVGIGSNLGDPRAQVRSAIAALGHLPETRLLAASSLYRTAPVGYSGPARLRERRRAARDRAAPRALLERLQAIEARRRARAQRSRTRRDARSRSPALRRPRARRARARRAAPAAARACVRARAGGASSTPMWSSPGAAARSSGSRCALDQTPTRLSSAPHLEKYRYIVVEGPIGAGKTSLARRLAARLGGATLLEQPEENPFLRRFYHDSARYALPTQLFFLFQRVDQLRSAGAARSVRAADGRRFPARQGPAVRRAHPRRRRARALPADLRFAAAAGAGARIS